jgi:hypothetical protein
MKSSAAALVALLTLTYAPLAGAHHSYADYERDERYAFSGTLTDVQWGNPHILLFVSDGAHELRIEWVTTAGADRTGVLREQFSPGDRITVIGSRNRNPEVKIMTLVKELVMTEKDWRWVSPSQVGAR